MYCLTPDCYDAVDLGLLFLHFTTSGVPLVFSDESKPIFDMMPPTSSTSAAGSAAATRMGVANDRTTIYQPITDRVAGDVTLDAD